MDKTILILIHATDSTISAFQRQGLWDRIYFSLNQYSKHFDSIEYFTSDSKNFQRDMPSTVKHHCIPIGMNIFGLRHIAFFILLVIASYKWKNKKAVIRVIGVQLPVVPLLKMISGKNIILSFEYDWACEMKRLYPGIKSLSSHLVQSLALNNCDHAFCTMDWLEKIAKEEYRVLNTSILPNFVDTSTFYPDPSKRDQIVYVGRHHWSKGGDTLIKSFKKFFIMNPTYSLIIIGSGDKTEEWKSLAEDNDKITFTGPLRNNDVAKLLSCSRIFVLPTKTREGHPRALVEAMSSGCICVASNVPGNRDVLYECDTPDLLFEPDDVESLYTILNYAIHYNRTNQIDFALKNYSHEKVFENESKVLIEYSR